MNDLGASGQELGSLESHEQISAEVEETSALFGWAAPADLPQPSVKTMRESLASSSKHLEIIISSGRALPSSHYADQFTDPLQLLTTRNGGVTNRRIAADADGLHVL
jgi:hypothetical protein